MIKTNVKYEYAEKLQPEMSIGKFYCLKNKLSCHLIILCTNLSEDKDLFEGVVISCIYHYNVGFVYKNWVRKSFEEFEGTIIIEQTKDDLKQ